MTDGKPPPVAYGYNQAWAVLMALAGAEFTEDLMLNATLFGEAVSADGTVKVTRRKNGRYEITAAEDTSPEL
jgi:hypothetical protein